MNHKTIIAIFTIILIGLTSLHLLADTNPITSFSNGIYSDEIWRLQPEKDYIQNGKYNDNIEYNKTDKRKTLYLKPNPIVATTYRIPLILGGINYTSIRIWAIIFTTLTMITTALLINKYYNKKTMTTFLALYSTNFLALELGKLMLLETFTLFWITESYILLILYLEKKKNYILYTSSILLSAAIMTKITSLFFLPLIPITIILHTKKFDKKNTTITLLIIATATITAFTIRPEISTHIGLNLITNTQELTRAIWLLPRNRWLIFNAITGILTITAITKTLWKNKLKIWNTNTQDTIIITSTIWIILLQLSMAISNYQPTRYLIPMTTPTILLASTIFYKKTRKITKIILILAITINLTLFFTWAPTNNIQQAQQEYKNLKGNAICGGLGQIIFWENNNIKCHAGSTNPTDIQKLKELNIKYIILTEQQKDYYKNQIQLEEIGKWQIRHDKIIIYKIKSMN